jgi:hypothetical protein
MKPKLAGKISMKIREITIRIVKRMLNNESGISGWQIAVVLIASMAIPAVFTHTTLYAGLPSTQKNQEAVCSVPQEAPNPRNCVVASGIYELNDADDAWIASPYVTAKPDSTSYVEGSASANFKIGDDFTTGAIACHDITGDTGTLDLSDCNRVTFWIKSSANLDNGVLQLRLSEGDYATGTTESLAIPGSVLDGSSWQKATVSLSGTTINYDAVRSVALYAATDPGAVTIWLDIIETPPALSTSNPVKPYMNELVCAVVKEAALPC